LSKILGFINKIQGQPSISRKKSPSKEIHEKPILKEKGKHKVSVEILCEAINNVNNVHGGLKAERQSANSPFTPISMLKTNMCFFLRFLKSTPKNNY